MSRYITVVKSLDLQQMLKERAMTTNELIAASGFSQSSISRWLRKMREVGSVYVAGYREDVAGRMFAAQYAWGSKPDAKRPGLGLTDAERMKIYRQRRKEREML